MQNVSVADMEEPIAERQGSLCTEYPLVSPVPMVKRRLAVQNDRCPQHGQVTGCAAWPRWRAKRHGVVVVWLPPPPELMTER